MNRLYRSRKNKMIAGVVSGIAESYNLNIDVAALRVLLTILALFMPVLVLVYFIAAVILPKSAA